MSFSWILSSDVETRAFGKMMAASLEPNSILAISGNLGTGKTSLVQGLAQGLGVEDPIQSPTFVYVNAYHTGRMPLFHLDLYRLASLEDFLSLGFDEYWTQGGVVAIEWPEKIVPIFPDGVRFIALNYLDGERRRATMTGPIPSELIRSCQLLNWGAAKLWPA